jgi:hypothetical protein
MHPGYFDLFVMLPEFFTGAKPSHNDLQKSGEREKDKYVVLRRKQVRGTNYPDNLLITKKW